VGPFQLYGVLQTGMENIPGVVGSVMNSALGPQESEGAEERESKASLSPPYVCRWVRNEDLMISSTEASKFCSCSHPQGSSTWWEGAIPRSTQR